MSHAPTPRDIAVRDEPGSTIHVLLLADPGLPSRRMEDLRVALAPRLTELFDRHVEVRATVATIRLDPGDLVDLDSTANALNAKASTGTDDGEDHHREPAPENLSELLQHEDVDIVLALTEMPRRSAGRPLVAEILPRQRTAVVACPTAGMLTTRRLGSVLVQCAARLLPEVPRRTPLPSLPFPASWSEGGSTGVQRLLAPRWRGALRTLAGMVVTNEPWRTAPHLGGALAAASAAGAFGVFYNSIWQMSASLTSLRLATISVLAIGMMSAWLIVSNRLWERTEGYSVAAMELYYNLSTLITIVLCVVGLYVILFVLILAAGLIVIDPDFLSSILGRPATFRRYVDIAWLSASLGVVAGGLGASFDSRTDLRQLTHRGRERLRRQEMDEAAR